MNRRLLLFASMSVICVCHCSYSFGEDLIRDAVVKIEATRQRPDYFSPWRKASSTQSGGSGVIIDFNGLHVLTNAHVVSFASQLYVQPNQSAEKFSATVVAVAPGMDLALLKVDDSTVLSQYSPLQLSDDLPHTKNTVNVYGFPIGGNDLSVTEGIVSRIEFGRYYFGSVGTRIQVDAALNPGNSGGPAVANDRIVGLVFSRIQNAENIGYLIPADEIRLFLKDVEDGSYDGKPIMFDDLQTAENVALRARLNLDDTTTGMIVSKPYQDEDSYPLKRWDVITHIGPHAIDNLGLVQVRDDLRLRFYHFIPKLMKDDKIELTIVRESEQITLQFPVQYKRERLLPTLKHGYPEYAIFGPLVFSTASQELAQGAASRHKLLTYLMMQENPLIGSMSLRPTFPGEQLVIVSSRMFSHPIRKGYSSPVFSVLTHVNDQPVKHLAHLVRLIRDCSDDFVEFTFAGRTETIVFRREELMKANEIILEAEGIRHEFSPRLREIWTSSK